MKLVKEHGEELRHTGALDNVLGKGRQGKWDQHLG